MVNLDELIAAQCGMVARRQLLSLGHDRFRVRNQLAAGRWVQRTSRVISTFTGEPTTEQRRWLGVLHAGPRSMLGGLTAAEHAGLRRWEREPVTVLVDDELSFEPVEGVDFFRSRRSFELLVRPADGLPTCQLEPAVLMWAAYDAPNRAAHAVLASVVQQRLTTPERLLRWIDLLRPPDRQRPRLDRAGNRRWTDCEWDLDDGRVLVLEVDGSFHMEVEHWGADKKRARRLTTPRRIVVGCTAYELRHEPDDVALDLLALGVPKVPCVPQGAA